MGFFHTLALIMLTLVGYSSGVVFGRRGREIPPAWWELLLIIGLWTAGLQTQAFFGRWGAIGFWLLAAMLTAAVITAVRVTRSPIPLPASELPEHARPTADPTASPHIFKRAWHAWTVFALQMGTVQGRLLMGFFYFFIVTPFGLGSRLLSDPMGITQTPPDTGWQTPEFDPQTIDNAREQG